MNIDFTWVHRLEAEIQRPAPCMYVCIGEGEKWENVTGKIVLKDFKIRDIKNKKV